MNCVWIPYLLLVTQIFYLKCYAEKSRRSSKKHKTETPSNPSLESLQETPGLQPRTVPKIKETSLPSATAGEGDNPSLNNPKSSDEDTQAPSSQTSGQLPSSSSQSQSFSDSSVSSASSGSRGSQNEQFIFGDEVPHSQSSESSKASNLQSGDSTTTNAGMASEPANTQHSQNNDGNDASLSQSSDVSSASTNQGSDTSGASANQGSDTTNNPAAQTIDATSSSLVSSNAGANKGYGNLAYELFSRAAQYTDASTATRREYTAQSNGNEALPINNWQPADVNISSVYKNSDLNANGQAAGNVPIGTAFSPFQYVISTTDNNNNTAMNSSIGQPAPELIVPVAVAQQVEKKEGTESAESSAEIRTQNKTVLNSTFASPNSSLPISSNISSITSGPSPLLEAQNITSKPTNKVDPIHKASKKSKLSHKRSRPHHHHHHKHHKASKRGKSKRPHSEPVPETGVDKTTPKFDWAKYENMTKLIAKMKGGGADYPPLNIGSLLSLFPSEVGIRKEDIPSVLRSFVNQEGNLATQDDIAKMDRESIDADAQALKMVKPDNHAKGQSQTKVAAQSFAAKPSGTPSQHPSDKHAQSLPINNGPIQSPSQTSASPTSSETSTITKTKASPAVKVENNKSPALQKVATKAIDKSVKQSAANAPESAKLHHADTSNKPAVNPPRTPSAIVQQAIPPEPPLSLFTGASPPTVKATIADTVAADTGEKMTEEVRKMADISLPDNIPKECGGLVKSYTNGEMTMKEYLQKMRKCKFINNPNKDRYQQALLKKEAVTKLIHSDAEINQEAYKYALQRVKDYEPSKKDTAQANAIMAKWRSSTFGNSIRNKANVPDAIKSFMSVQKVKNGASVLAALQSPSVSKSTIKSKTNAPKDEGSLESEKDAILAQITGQTGEMLSSFGKEKIGEKGKVASELTGKDIGIESNTNLELLSSKKAEVPNKILSLPKIDALQKMIEQKTSIRSAIPKAPKKENAAIKTAKLLPELSFKDAITMAAAKGVASHPEKETTKVKDTSIGDKKADINTILAPDKKDILTILDHHDETAEQSEKVPVTAEAASLVKKEAATTPVISGMVNANLIKALQSMGAGQGFGLLGNKGVTLIAAASKRSAEEDVEFQPSHRRRKTHRKRSLLRKIKRGVSSKNNDYNASERSRMDMPPNIKPGPKLMDKIRDMSSVIATP